MYDMTDREAMRRVFFEAWDKSKGGNILTPLEDQVVAVIRAHPEYHAMFDGKEPVVQTTFLHLGLHLAIRDQLKLEQPVGIGRIYKKLIQAGCAPLEVEHKMMACLSKVMWTAQQTQCPFNEQQYQSLLLALIEEKP